MAATLALSWPAFGASPALAVPPFEVLRVAEWNGFDRTLWQRSVVLVRGQSELDDLWRRRLGRRDSPPAVDFRRHSAVFYFAGMRPESGDRYRVDDVQVRGGRLIAEVVEIRPVGCVRAQAARFPFVMILTVPWRGEVEFDQRFDSYSCER